MCFGCSKEPSHWEGSFEYPQHMFWMRNKEIVFQYTLLSGGLLFKLSPRFFKKAKGIRPSVCPLCYLLLNHWTKFSQIWCVSYSHKWDVQHQTFFCPAPWGPGEGSKSQISFNFNYSHFQIFLYQTFSALSQMKDTKHIRRNFYSVAWVMPQGWDFGALGCQGVKKFFFSNMVM